MTHRDITHPLSGGAERTVYEVGRRLVLKGHKLDWYSVSSKGLQNEEYVDGISIHRMSNNFAAHLSVPVILRRRVPDVVIDDMGHAIPWGSENFLPANGVVFFRHLHRRSLKGQTSGIMRILISGLEASYPLIYRKWPFVVESSSSAADLGKIGIQRNRIKLIPPGVDHEKFVLGKKSENPSLIYYGGFRDYKRPWEPLYILSELLNVDRRYSLTMIGSGPSLEKVKDIANELKISDSIFFTGRISNEELREILGKSWINVHTSITEGFGYSILEASSSGVPTVAYSVPGVRDIIETGMNGILVQDGNRSAAVDSILQISDSYENGWKQRSRSVSEKYSWDETVEKWERLLRAIGNVD